MPRRARTATSPRPSPTLLPVLLLLPALVLGPLHAAAQEAGAGRPERITANTLRFDVARGPGDATLADAAWLVGEWEGEGLGGTVQEVWAAPAGGRMTGAFTSLVDGAVRFHEIMALVERGGSLELWVKHFSDEFVATRGRSDAGVPGHAPGRRGPGGPDRVSTDRRAAPGGRLTCGCRGPAPSAAYQRVHHGQRLPLRALGNARHPVRAGLLDSERDRDS